MLEEWKQINFFSKYEISNYGRIRKIQSNKILNPSIRKRGYREIKLINDQGIRKNLKIHRLVALAFIPNPNNYPCINHKDEDPSNNCINNLEWCTHQYNNTYGTRIDKARPKQQHAVVQYDSNMNVINEFDSVNEAGKSVSISPCTISSCLSGHQKTAKGFIWKYKN